MNLSPQQKKVLKLVVKGCKNYDFHRSYILNPTARVSELRKKGFDIKAIREKKGVYRYEMPHADKIRAMEVL